MKVNSPPAYTPPSIAFFARPITFSPADRKVCRPFDLGAGAAGGGVALLAVVPDPLEPEVPDPLAPEAGELAPPLEPPLDGFADGSDIGPLAIGDAGCCAVAIGAAAIGAVAGGGGN